MKNLEGKTILLTRADEDNALWARTIEDRGGRVKILPCNVCEPIRDTETAASLQEALGQAEWLVLTSRRGAKAVSELHPGSLPDAVRIATVGAATAEEAQALLGRCDLVGSSGTGLGLAQDLAAALARDGSPAGARIVAATAEGAAHHLEEVLEPQGVRITRISVYRTLPAAPKGDKLNLSTWGLDAILLASPSAAQGFKNLANPPMDVDVISIGPATTQAARSLGIDVTAQAEHPGLDALLEVL